MGTGLLSILEENILIRDELPIAGTECGIHGNLDHIPSGKAVVLVIIFLGLCQGVGQLSPFFLCQDVVYAVQIAGIGATTVNVLLCDVNDRLDIHFITL